MRHMSARRSPARWAERMESRILFTVFGGVDFPQGASSFADSVISYQPANAQNIDAGAKHPATALGPPDGKNVSLGQGGSLSLAFTDNVLTNSASPAKDLWVFEVGPNVESTFVFVRPTLDTKPLLNAKTLDPDGDGFYAVGEIKGSTRGIDLDAAMPGFTPGKLRFDAVLLVDDPNQGGGGTGTPGADINAVGAITSSTVVPFVSVSATDPNAAEAGRDPGTFTFSRTGPTTSPLLINFSIGGTATNKVDYPALPTSIIIPKGLSQITLSVKPIDDTIVEGNETVQLSITPALSYAINPAGASAVVNIADNDKPKVAITAVDPNASEPFVGVAGTGLFVLTRNSTLGSLTISLTVGGTATINADYALTVTGGTSSYSAATKTLTITLAAGAQTAAILVTPKLDAVKDPAETVVLSLVANPNYVVVLAGSSAKVTIADDPLV